MCDDSVPDSACTACGKLMDGARCVDGSGARPVPNDISVCLYCGTIMAYADDLKLRDLTDREMIQVAGDPQLIKIALFRKKFGL